MKSITRTSMLLALILGIASLQLAQAETRITYRSAKTSSSYYQMGVQIAEAMKTGSNGDIIVTVEEGQGSVSNVIQVPSRGADYVFTTPPVLVKLAKAGKAMFKDKGNPAYDEIRALFPALKNGQIDGFVTAGSYPAPNVVEAAASMPVKLLSLGDAERAQSASVGKRKQLMIPAGTYAGQDEAVSTTTLEVVAYATTKMSDDTAYQLTKTYWEMKAKMGADNPWWNGVDKTYLKAIIGPIHAGAEKYYREVGFL